MAKVVILGFLVVCVNGFPHEGVFPCVDGGVTYPNLVGVIHKVREWRK